MTAAGLLPVSDADVEIGKDIPTEKKLKSCYSSIYISVYHAIYLFHWSHHYDHKNGIL